MTRDQLAIGNTGAQLISKFNTNFGNVIIGDHIFNVEDYGAVHDGVTDDTEAIQDAINAACTANGGRVYFPAGTYLIAGALKNDIACTVAGNSYDVDFNSQLYIKPDPVGSSMFRTITLEGECPNPYIPWNYNGSGASVLLKSTIAGSGAYPSVIGTGKAGETYPYNHIVIKNINISVNPFVGTTGPSMCGLNLYYSDYNVIDNVFCGIHLNGSISTATEPSNHVFGLCLGRGNGNFPIIKNFKAIGFYYGLIIGDGVHASDVFLGWNYIGLMSAFGVQCGSVIDYAVINWNAYDIASQQETLFGVDAAESHLYINHLLTENNPGYGPAWTTAEDTILDVANNLKGYINYQYVPSASIVKGHGGNNMLLKKKPNEYYNWTTATRPSLICQGYNETTGKLEFYDGSNWHDLY